MLEGPLAGAILGTLDEGALPKTLTGTIARLDLGAPPAPKLTVGLYAPGSAAPGQRLSYVLDYRNDGLLAAQDVLATLTLDDQLIYVSGSGEALFDELQNEVGWHIGAMPALSSGRVEVTADVRWGLPATEVIENHASILDVVTGSHNSDVYANGTGAPAHTTVCAEYDKFHN
jgi:uncharacterized repeat protein (TIGR01451 family)